MKRVARSVAVVATVAAGALAVPAAADPADDAFWADEQTFLAKHLADAGKACDATFAFEWLDKETLRTEAAKTKHSPFGVCALAVDAVRDLCREGATERAAVKKEITGFRCGFAKPRSLALDGSVLVYRGNNVEPNFDRYGHAWLVSHL